MSSWQEIQKEIQLAGSNTDLVRRNKYKKLVEITKRPLIVYASAFLSQQKQPFQSLMAIDLSDKDGFSEVTKNVKEKGVDILVHSPGGSAEATESIVGIIRDKFEDVRFMVTGVAKSAATMLVLSGNEIVMSNSAELGPIDPQIRIGDRFSPAGSIIEQFDKASKIIKEDPSQLPVWVPILEKYAPCLLVDCENYIELAERLVKKWMGEYMFNGHNTRKTTETINNIAKHLTNEKENLSHARKVGFDQLKNLGVNVKKDTEYGDGFKNALNDVHLALTQALSFSNAVKIFENSYNEALILNVNVAPIPPINK